MHILKWVLNNKKNLFKCFHYSRILLIGLFLLKSVETILYAAFPALNKQIT